MTKTAPQTTAESNARLVPALPRVLLRMPDLAVAPRPTAAPLAVEAEPEVERQPLVADAPPAEPPKPEPPKPSYRVDAAHAPRAPHAPRRTPSERPAPGKTAAAAEADRTSPASRKPLYQGADGRRERMKAAKAPVWRTRLFLAMIAGVLIWGTITISTGHRGGGGPRVGEDAVEAPPFETDIQLGELGEAPGFTAPGLDQHSHDEHLPADMVKPAPSATVEIAPPLQSRGAGDTAAQFDPFGGTPSGAAAGIQAPQISGRPAGTQPTAPPISSADLLGGGSQTEYVANRPSDEVNRTAPAGGSMYGTGTQAPAAGAAPAGRSDADAPWWRTEPRDAATGETSPADRPIFDQTSTQSTAPAAARLGMPEPVSPTGSRYGQQGLSSSDLLGGGGSAAGTNPMYFAPGDPAANRPSQARLDGNYVEPTESRLR